ncbi:MAG: hypothetical protein U1E36_05985 [Rickettsiales bacterium]
MANVICVYKERRRKLKRPFSMRLANAAWDIRKNVVSSLAALYAG